MFGRSSSGTGCCLGRSLDWGRLSSVLSPCRMFEGIVDIVVVGMRGKIVGRWVGYRSSCWHSCFV